MIIYRYNSISNLMNIFLYTHTVNPSTIYIYIYIANLIIITLLHDNTWSFVARMTLQKLAESAYETLSPPP